MVQAKRERSPSYSSLPEESCPKIPRRSFYPFQHLPTTETTRISLCPVRIFAKFSYLPSSLSGYEPDDDSGDEECDHGSGYAYNAGSNCSSDDPPSTPYFPGPLHHIPIRDFYTMKTSAYPDLLLDEEVRCRRRQWREELVEESWRLLTNLNIDIRDEEILEVVGTHLNDMIPPEAWEVELTWRERGILKTRRDAYMQSVKTAVVRPDPQATETDPQNKVALLNLSRETATDSQATITDSSQGVLKTLVNYTEADSSQYRVEALITDLFQDEDPLHGIPADSFYKEETKAYSDEALDDELQWRRRSWQGVLPEETWAQLTDPAIDITTDDFVDKVGHRESDDIQADAWEVELAWRERAIRIARRDAAITKTANTAL